MKTIKVISLSMVIALPALLSGCASLFDNGSSQDGYYSSQSYYNFDDNGGNATSDGASRSYGGDSGGSPTTPKPRSDKPSTSATAKSIENSAAVPIQPPSLE